ncbi:hypothetical protein C41B8_05563 [Salinisphaera hydrothermalis C41B8]|uniref:Uncharacterized protein n=2 Tax=Salinisphaera TaxID=180541 RepID=A0A084INR0_SALHC|nr:hypothetical protein C41B8_05563 [Salinisphaera hydrothermalis C41B8]
MHHYGYAMSEVMSVASMGLFRDWVQRQLPTWLVDDAIAAAHAKNGGRPGQPAYYRNFVNQMATELETAQQALKSARVANFSRPPKGQGGSDAGTDSERDQPGVAGFYADFGRD